VALALTPWTASAGAASRIAWIALAAVYGAMIAGLAAVVAILHRRARLTGLVAVGAVASHLAFGAGVLAGLVARPVRQALRGSAVSPTPDEA
jgi:hypothetical protein